MQTLFKHQTVRIGLVIVAAWAAPAVCGAQQAAKPPVKAPAAAKAPAATKPPAAPSGDAAGKTPLVNYLNPDTLMQSDAYSKVAVVNTPSRTVYFSGAIPVDKSYNIVGRDDLREQVKQSLKNLALVMEAAGVSKKDIVKLTVNIVYKDNRDTFTVSEELVSFFERDDPPTTTIAGSPFIIADGILVQIDAIGVLPPAKAKS